MNTFVKFSAHQFVDSIIDSAVKKYIFINKNMSRFDLLLKKAVFGFKQHQFDGVKWCVQNELKFANTLDSVRGGIIADEMGLGKTILMIGTMFVNFVNKTIIVVPPILIEQWSNEIYKCSGHKPLIYHGKNKKSIGPSELAKACIVITSYNTLLPTRKGKGKGKAQIAKVNELLAINWDRVIFDEAHHLRNFKTIRFSYCKQLVAPNNRPAPIKWLVSGTPIQNKRSDFYSLCNVLGLKPEFYKHVENVPIIVKDYVLRRTKDEVGIQLPPVNIQNIVVPWQSQNEKMLSEDIHSLIPNQSGVSYTKASAVADLIWSKTNGAVMLTAMLRARQSCVLPGLMKEPIKRCVLADKSGMYFDALQYTSKLDAVIKLMLERKDNGNGKIVFCHYIDEIDMIAKRLRDGGLAKVVTYDGRNSGSTSKLCEAADAIILQIQTGCEGLNLQKYFSEIYFVSPHWNPAVEDQAIARCHRIGQEKEVHVFRFEMDGFDKVEEQEFAPITLDKYVNKVQDGKRDIANSILA